MHDVWDQAMSFAFVPPTQSQRRLTMVFIGCLFAAWVGMAPFALAPLARTDGYIPAVQAVLSSTDFVTAMLLLGEYALARSTALLALASGYLFSALIVIAHTLTFPGAFAPTGLLGAGTQTAAWLYVFWHAGFPTAVAVYAWLKPRTPDVRSSAAAAIGWSVTIVIGLVAALTCAVTAWDESLPVLVTSERGFSLLGDWINGISLLVATLSLVLLWVRRSSMLDWCLIVVVGQSIAEAALVTFIAASRYSVSFYSGRMLNVVASSFVLAALLWAAMNWYARRRHTVTPATELRPDQALRNAVAIHETAKNQPDLARVLLVDDEPSLLRAMRRGFANDFDVHTAESAEEALTVIRNSEPFAVVVADFQMPGMDGCEFLSHVAALSPRAVRIMMSGDLDTETGIHLANTGHVFKFFSKPFDLAELRAALDEAVRQNRRSGHSRQH